MKFTIVIPTYNGADYIEEALLSAINQTRKADAIIVSDDNSTDNTLDICSRYKDEISIHRNEGGPSGFVEGWNNAIRLVDDGYIAILHQDDLLAPTFLEEAEKALSKYPDVKHLFTPCNYIDEDGKVIREPDYCDGEIHRYTKEQYIDAYLTMGSPHVHRCPGVITHRSIFDVCTYRKEAGHIADDDFFYRVGQYTDVVGIFKVLASYREHRKSETGHLNDWALDIRLANDYLFQVEEVVKDSFYSEELKSYIKSKASWFVYCQFVNALKSNDLGEINAAICSCIRLNELNVKLPLKGRLLSLLYRMFGRRLTCKLINVIR